MSLYPLRYVGREESEIVHPIELGNDELVVDLRISVHEEIPEPDGAGKGFAELLGEHAVATEKPQRMGVRLRRSPPLGRTKVLRGI